MTASSTGVEQKILIYILQVTCPTDDSARFTLLAHPSGCIIRTGKKSRLHTRDLLPGGLAGALGATSISIGNGSRVQDLVHCKVQQSRTVAEANCEKFVR